MATTVKPNTEYVTSPNVSKKYNPFDAFTLRLGTTEEDKALYSKILTNRFDLLKNLSLLPQTLHFATTDWAQTQKAEEGNKPPLIIISSNRSAWIKSGIAAADAELATKENWKSFNSVSDFRALYATAGQKVSPPIYCPKRIGAASLPRSVFVVVHMSEYQTYNTALAGSGITVVGWEFAKAIKESPSLAGFGASRFAAVQFCKTLRETVKNKVWDYAWFFDDNVVALTNFPGFEVAEAEIAKVTDKVCIGFKGADFAYPFSDIPPWAKTLPAEPPKNLPAPKNQGILQQVGLWNIKYLATNGLNFPPVFVTSAEDISLNRYFNLQKIKYTIYLDITVEKEVASLDGKSAETVNTARDYYAKVLGAAESAAAAKDAKPPPPVNVNYQGKDYTVDAFIVDQFVDAFIGKHQPPITPEKLFTARCQAAEQISKTAIPIKLIADNALNTTFKINGSDPQPVQLHNVK
jgi:hypothetical protein